MLRTLGPMKRLMVFVPLASAHKKSGATALVAAMLDRALEDVRAGNVKGANRTRRVRVQNQLRTEALAWVCEGQAKERVGSFEWCCAALNLDVEAVRTRIVRSNVSTDPSTQPPLPRKSSV